MTNVNKTLYIPLYGKALVSRRGILLSDKKAEEIWDASAFPLKGKSKSKWLAFYMAMRARVFDDWTKAQLEKAPDALVLHIGCGLDSRCERVKTDAWWIDIDFPEVIGARRAHYRETAKYRMCPGDLRDPAFLNALPQAKTAIVVMEGVSMYVKQESLTAFFSALADRFSAVKLLTDCYSSFAAKASRYKNPVNDVGVTEVHGIDDPNCLAGALVFKKEHEMTPPALIDELKGAERLIFKNLYAGTVAKKMYRLYEYEK